MDRKFAFMISLKIAARSSLADFRCDVTYLWSLNCVYCSGELVIILWIV